MGEPFRGLQSYEFEHAPIFFGRNATVIKGTEQLVDNASRSRVAFLTRPSTGLCLIRHNQNPYHSSYLNFSALPPKAAKAGFSSAGRSLGVNLKIARLGAPR
jgi:hypothetical protein